ncbi:anti-sigma factor domain-containing protein [Pontibacillus salicampi]|uniref:Anti-sigma factor domain-containing protein n=1 Tax=Pontibacillus salicampi TaxID=1449801 RepID=A0ABV6LM44_9BACI
MKKGIIMEQQRRFTVVMTEDGMFYKAKRLEESHPGDEVSFEPLEEKQSFPFEFPRIMMPKMKLIAMVVALLIAILPFYTWYDSNRAYAYVNIDMNPSLEMKVNDNMNVIELIPLNEDATSLVNTLNDWKHKAVEKVTVTLIQKGRSEGFMEDNQQVMIGVSYNRNSKDGKELTKSIDAYLQSNTATLTYATFEVPKALRKQAQDTNKSMNEVYAQTLIQANQESDNGTTNSSQETKVKATSELEPQKEDIIRSFYNDSSHSESNKGTKQSTVPPTEVSLKKEEAVTKSENTETKATEEIAIVAEEVPPGIMKKLEQPHALLESIPPGTVNKWIHDGDKEAFKQLLRDHLKQNKPSAYDNDGTAHNTIQASIKGTADNKEGLTKKQHPNNNTAAPSDSKHRGKKHGHKKQTEHPKSNIHSNQGKANDM